MCIVKSVVAHAQIDVEIAHVINVVAHDRPQRSRHHRVVVIIDGVAQVIGSGIVRTDQVFHGVSQLVRQVCHQRRERTSPCFNLDRRLISLLAERRKAGGWEKQTETDD